MKVLAILLALTGTLPDNDTINCPKPKGDVAISENWSSTMPTHIERMMPHLLEVDVACRVNSFGRFVDCRFAPRQELNDRQEAVTMALLPRIMRHARTTVADQKCVHVKLTFDWLGEGASETPPDEAARKGIVPN